MPRRRPTSPDQLEMFALEPTFRLFIGLLPDAITQRALDRQRAAWPMPRSAVPTQADRFHLTLGFLGDVALSRALELKEALAEVPMEETRLTLRKPAVWGVAVVQPDEHAGLRVLHDNLRRPLQRVGLRAGTAWTPHVTIARHTHGAVPPARIPRVDWPVHDFALVWSRFEPTARYEVLRRYGAAPGSTGSASGTNLVPCP